jgi:cytochrome c-type biogenesis protein CcmH/NrfG
VRRVLGSIGLACVLVGLASAAQAQLYANIRPGQREEGGAPDPVNATRDYVDGVTAIKDKQYKTAVRLLGRVADQWPRSVATWRLLGVAYAGDTNWKASLRAYEHALRLAPDDVASHAGRAAALVALKDPKAQEEAAWLKARTAACAGTCPDAAMLKALEERGPFATPSAG